METVFFSGFKYPSVMEPLLASIEALTVESEQVLTQVQETLTEEQMIKLKVSFNDMYII